MKQLFFILSLIFFINIANCQENILFEYLGTLELPGRHIIPIKLSFKKNADGTIEGTTVTDMFGEDNTKSRIIGRFNAEKKTISFHETENLSTKSKEPASSFCYIYVEKAKIKTVSGKSIIHGRFTGKYASGQNCTNGNIYLIGADFIEQLANKVLTPENIKNNDSLEKARKAYTSLKQQTEYTVLKNKETMKINWESEEIILEVWDGASDDNDEVSIFINDTEVLEKYGISQKKKILVYPFKNKTCSIRIVAINEGNSPPNTVFINVRDGNKNTPLLSKLKKDESAYILLNKK